MPKRIKKVVFQENQYSVHLRGDVWYVQFKDPNTKQYLPQKSLHLRYSDGMTRLHAEREAERLWKNGLVDELVKANTNKPSVYFSGFVKDFFKVEGKYHHYRMSEGHTIKASTLDAYRGNLALYIEPYFHDKLLKKITRKDVFAFRSYLLVEKRLDPQTAQNIFKNFKTILKYAIQEELIYADPSSLISIETPKKPKAQILTTEEIQKLLQCSWKDERVKIATYIASETGARRGEVLALRWKNIDFTHNRIFIHESWNSEYGFTSTKNGDDRYPPLSPELKIVLQKYQEKCICDGKNDLLFPSTVKGNRPMDTKKLDSIFYDALNTIGINESERKERGITFHNLRHHLVTVLHEKGVSPLTIRQIVGHSDDKIEWTYFHGNGNEVISVLSNTFGDAMKVS